MTVLNMSFWSDLCEQFFDTEAERLIMANAKILFVVQIKRLLFDTIYNYFLLQFPYFWGETSYLIAQRGIESQNQVQVTLLSVFVIVHCKRIRG